MFSWEAVEGSSDIQRFERLLAGLDDEALMAELEGRRRGRRNDNPVRCLWNALLAGLVFGHESIESLRRELRRNAELRQACGFDPLRGDQAVPSKFAFSRFLVALGQCPGAVAAVFEAQVDRLEALLPDFGRRLAADGKAIPAWRKGDTDADVGHKTVGQPDGPDGPAEKTLSWFGYKLHLICDARYELPTGFRVTAASANESPHLQTIVEHLNERHPELIQRAESLAADRGYDDGADKAALWDDYGILPLIPARDLHHGAMRPLNPARSDTIYVSPTGEVSCKIRPFAAPAEAYAAMQFQGFEADRQALKFRCPAAAFNLTCRNQEACQGPTKDTGFGRVVRVPLETDRRLFLPLYPHSYRFQDLYRQRTAVERLFFRFDHLYGFERHTTRGLKRMTLRVTLALTAMLATAAGWIEAGRLDKLRCMAQAA
jgi:hypothetical protein